ncbi:hypothetical protein Agabi119p4_10514 [Agaricus bisporus var. burnettii]|uniref:Uncharacterized protein n=1 Tax=Agaricus bisporus var. burnettii TaxID=192524 RepID=A0A8H7C315_AGABI|nr:hypothetical protein Agabi119p4_10514 [Agaricus bisporus var. burnettii]
MPGLVYHLMIYLHPILQYLPFGGEVLALHTHRPVRRGVNLAQTHERSQADGAHVELESMEHHDLLQREKSKLHACQLPDQSTLAERTHHVEDIVNAMVHEYFTPVALES